jgi:hypothetical protein
MGRAKRCREIIEKAGKRPCQRSRPRHENIVVAPRPIKGKDRRSGRSKTPFGPVALDRTPDFPACSDPYADELRLGVRVGTHLQCY